MNKHDGCRRGFTICSESWYSKAVGEPGVLDEIMIGMYHPDGGTTGEFGVRWTVVGRNPTPRLEVFNDAWHALMQFGDVLQWMASVDGKHVTPQEFAEALRSFGIEDLTERTNTGPAVSPDVQELVEALRWFELFHKRAGEDSLEQFERVAEVFRRETGYLRPGKDCVVHSSEERALAWNEWIAAGLAKARAALSKYGSKQR